MQCHNTSTAHTSANVACEILLTIVRRITESTNTILYHTTVFRSEMTSATLAQVENHMLCQ